MPDNPTPGTPPEEHVTPAVAPEESDDKLGPDDKYDPDKALRDLQDEAHRRKMQEMFGDLDEGEEAPEDTVESLRAELKELQEKAENATGALRRARTGNQELVQKIEDANKVLAGFDEKAKADKKVAIAELAAEIQPVIDALSQDLAAIDPQARATDVKFDKLAKGVELTVNQFSGVFNKFGVKPASPPAPSAPGAPEPPPAAPDNKPGAPEEPKNETPQPAAPDAPPKTDTLESLRAEIAELQQKYTDTTQALGRAQTDNLNLTRRVEEIKKMAVRKEAEIEEQHKYAAEGFVKQLLPAVDTLELGLCSVDKKTRAEDAKCDTFAQHIEKTLGNLTAVFNKFGIQAINPIDQPFDADKHEVVSVGEKEGAKPETVIQVAQKGYELHGKIVRPAKVIVTPAD
jgi:molecular chaperone GrpE